MQIALHVARSELLLIHVELSTSRFCQRSCDLLAKHRIRFGNRYEVIVIPVEEIVEDTTLGSLFRHALAAGRIGLSRTFLLVQTVKGRHEPRTL